MNNLFFLHIPKTAGTTFWQILIRNYGHSNILHPKVSAKELTAIEYCQEVEKEIMFLTALKAGLVL